MKKVTKKPCKNPSCPVKTFQPGHYGDLQQVGSGKDHVATISCPSCKGSGQKAGEKCRKCQGKKKIQQTCQQWYRGWWAQTRKPPRGMNDDERTRALAAAKKKSLRHWSLLVSAACSAMRKGELLGLTWGDVEDGKEIRSNFPLRGQWDDKAGFKETKTDSGRIAFLLKEAREAIALVRKGEAKEEKSADRIWPYTEVEAWVWWTDLQKRLRISNPDTRRPFRFHDLRHTAALRALERTGKLSDASTLCGHKNPATTAIYTQKRPEDFVKSMEG
jgi:integrase